MLEEIKLLGSLLLVLSMSGCFLDTRVYRLSQSISSSNGVSFDPAEIDKEYSHIFISKPVIIESDYLDLKVCLRNSSGEVVSNAQQIKLNLNLLGGSSTFEQGIFTFNQLSNCHELRLIGKASGSAAQPVVAILDNLNNTIATIESATTVEVKTPLLSFTGNSNSDNTVVNLRIFTSGFWTLTGLCDSIAGDVYIFGDSMGSEITTPCLAGNYFSQKIFYNSSGGTPYFQPFQNDPLVLIRQAEIIKGTRIYALPILDTVVIINNATQLQAMAVNLPQTTYILGSDIDLSTLSSINNFTRIGIGSSGSDRFSSKFYGDGHTISNLNMTNTSASYPSLFGYAQYPAIAMDLHFRNAYISTNQNHAGILAGHMRQSSLKRVSVEGTLISSGTNAGLIVGYGWSIDISESWSSGIINASGANVGGITGQLWDKKMVNCWSDAVISGTADSVGGLIGFLSIGSNNAWLENSYFTGTVSGDGPVGGLIGLAYGGLSTSNSKASFNLGNVSATLPSASYLSGGPVVGSNGFISAGVYYDQNLNTFTDFYSLSSLSCLGCDSRADVYTTSASLSEIQNFFNAKWEFRSYWKKNTSNSYPYMLKFNPR